MEALENVKSIIKNWWILLIIGILLIISSMYIYSTPEASYLTLSVFFALVILFDGVGSIVFSLSNREVLENWGWRLAGGILSTLIGLGLFIHPDLSMAILPLYVGFWVLLKGTTIIGTAFDLKSLGIDQWGWTLFFGIMNLIFGLLMIFNPLFGASAILIFTSLAFFMAGFSLIFVSFRLRKIKKAVEHLKETGKEKLRDIKSSVEDYINENSADMKDTLLNIKEKIDKAISDENGA